MSKSKNSTIEVQGTVVSVFNPDFNYGEFATIRSKAGLNSYKISMKVYLKMRKFSEVWSDIQFVLRTVAQLHWRSNISLLDKLEATSLRVWYLQKAIELGLQKAKTATTFIESKDPDRFVKIYDRVGSVVFRISHYINNSIPVRPLLVSQASPNVAGFSFWGLR